MAGTVVQVATTSTKSTIGGTVKTQQLLHVVEEGTQSAVERLSPYVEQALRESGEFADQTYTKLRPAIKEAQIRGARLAADTFDKVHPAIDDALDRVSPAVDATVRKVRPAVDDALGRIPGTVDFAREKVQAELLPQLAEQLRVLAAQPLAREFKVAVASAALADQLEQVSGTPKRSGWKTFGKIVLAGAVLGGVVVALRKLFSDPSAGWETHPSGDNAYVADPFAGATDVAETAEQKAGGLVDDVTTVAEDASAAVKDKAEEVGEDIEAKLDELAEKTDGGDADPLADSPYGEGSYVGEKPPSEYVIKGNDRSMKYHVPGMAAYDRTIAEVWFATEEAAQAAGFTKAQR